MPAFVLALILLLLGWLSLPSEACVTDSQCFIQCEKEKGRPCTDEDVFGPVYEEDHIQGADGPCQDLPPDHPDHCEEK
jgi:hypothetical protein